MLRVFEICQKDTRRQCVRANDGEGGGKAKMVVRQNCRGKKRQKLARNEARLAGSVITEWKTENKETKPFLLGKFGGKC